MLDLAASYGRRARDAASRDIDLSNFYAGGGSSGGGSGTGGGSGGGGSGGGIGGGWTPPGGGGGGWTPPGGGIFPPPGGGGGMCPASVARAVSDTPYVWAVSEGVDCDSYDPPEWSDRELNEEEKAALQEDLEDFNRLVSELDYFDTADEAANWLHEHGWFLTQKHGAEVASQIYQHDINRKFSIGKLVTSYHTAKVEGGDLNGSSPYKSPADAVLHADWHTHPNVGSDGFSLGDYQHRQRRFVSYQRGPYALYGTSLKYYDGIAAWSEYGGAPSPAVELPESIAIKYVECKQGYCL
uniref:SSU ribosomal protein S3p (S3e) n=1 Tax=Rheinheimera sp. BAL341 TaxID=1708203 RepID=A0A486XQP0_9GAMM